jgi:hypothetical protein
MTEAVARDHGVEVKVMHKEGRKKGTFEPIQPLWKVEDAFAQLGRSGRLRALEAACEATRECRLRQWQWQWQWQWERGTPC